MSNPGKIIRLSKIINPEEGKGVVVAADHGLMLGSIGGVFNLEKTLKRVIQGGPDAVLLSPGQAARLNHLFNGRDSPAILVRADWTNAFRTKQYTLPARNVARTRIIRPSDALALGASGIVTYYFLGCKEESEAWNFKLMSSFAKECEEVGLPFIVEPLPFGERSTGANFSDLVLSAVRMAVEAGADAIKTLYTGDKETFRRVVSAAKVPVLVLGGSKAKTMRDALEIVSEALEVGASGVVFGRQVIQSSDPTEFVKAVKAVVHEGRSVKETVGAMWEGPIRWKIDVEKCTGCHLCEVACTLFHERGFSFSKARIRLGIPSEGEWKPVACPLLLASSLSKPDSRSIDRSMPSYTLMHACIHDPACVKACGRRALTFNPELECIQLDEAKCSGCKRCVQECPLDLIQFDEERSIPLICDMCGGSPECVDWCQPKALHFFGQKTKP